MASDLGPKSTPEHEIALDQTPFAAVDKKDMSMEMKGSSKHLKRRVILKRSFKVIYIYQEFVKKSRAIHDLRKDITSLENFDKLN